MSMRLNKHLAMWISQKSFLVAKDLSATLKVTGGAQSDIVGFRVTERNRETQHINYTNLVINPSNLN